MARSIKQTCNVLSAKRDAQELRMLLENIKTDIVTLATALDTLATKLNSDTGVADTDYATNNAASVTLLD